MWLPDILSLTKQCTVFSVSSNIVYQRINKIFHIRNTNTIYYMLLRPEDILPLFVCDRQLVWVCVCVYECVCALVARAKRWKINRNDQHRHVIVHIHSLFDSIILSLAHGTHIPSYQMALGRRKRTVDTRGRIGRVEKWRMGIGFLINFIPLETSYSNLNWLTVAMNHTRENGRTFSDEYQKCIDGEKDCQ